MYDCFRIPDLRGSTQTRGHRIQRRKIINKKNIRTHAPARGIYADPAARVETPGEGRRYGADRLNETQRGLILACLEDSRGPDVELVHANSRRQLVYHICHVYRRMKCAFITKTAAGARKRGPYESVGKGGERHHETSGVAQPLGKCVSYSISSKPTTLKLSKSRPIDVIFFVVDDTTVFEKIWSKQPFQGGRVRPSIVYDTYILHTAVTRPPTMSSLPFLHRKK